MTKNTKQRLFEVMSALDKSFKPKLNEDLEMQQSDDPIAIARTRGRDSKDWTQDAINYVGGINVWNKLNPTQKEDVITTISKNDVNEAEKSSYSDDMVNDIKTLLGNSTSLSPKEIQQLATDYQVGPEEVQQTMQYVLDTNKENQPAIPQNSQEAQEVNDFFKFLKNNPKAGTVATVWYASTLDRYLAKPKQNDMVGRFIKLTKYGFEWERTYSQETEKVNPEWQVQQRKGGYTQVEGFSVVKRDKNGDEVFDIVPRTPKSIVLILDENGNVVDTLKTGELQGKYAEKFQPSFFAPAVPSSGSGVPFRALKLYAVKRLAAGGKEWINNKFKYEKYSNYFEQIPEPE